MCVSTGFIKKNISHNVSFLLTVNDEDTLHGLVNACSRCTLSAYTGKIVYCEEEDIRYSRGYCELACYNGTASGFICIEPRAKAPTSLRKRPGFSRSVLFRFSFSSVTSFSFLSLIPPLSVASSCGRNYRIFSDARTRLVDVRGWKRWY